MSFSLFGHKPVAEPEPAPVAAPAPVVRENRIAFDGLTEDYRLTGRLALTGRLSDALNRREELAISGVAREPVLGGVPELDQTHTRVDPYGFALVFAGSDTLPDHTREEQLAHKVRKLPYHVALSVGPFRVMGTIWLYAGTTAEELVAGRVKELFMPVTGAEVWLGETRIDARGADAVLVNRFELQGVEDI